MLTQIEWWGGILFVLGALTYRLVMGALEKGTGYDWYRWLMRLFFVLPGLLLAAYFYPLESIALQYAYLAALALALLVVAGVMVQEVTGDADSDEEKSRKKGADKAATAGLEDDEEGRAGWLVTIVGVAMLYSPVLAACGLACHKAWPMVQRLG